MGALFGKWAAQIVLHEFDTEMATFVCFQKTETITLQGLQTLVLQGQGPTIQWNAKWNAP
jgi:hypothetical protein